VGRLEQGRIAGVWLFWGERWLMSARLRPAVPGASSSASVCAVSPAVRSWAALTPRDRRDAALSRWLPRHLHIVLVAACLSLALPGAAEEQV